MPQDLFAESGYQPLNQLFVEFDMSASLVVLVSFTVAEYLSVLWIYNDGVDFCWFASAVDGKINRSYKWNGDTAK